MFRKIHLILPILVGMASPASAEFDAASTLTMLIATERDTLTSLPTGHLAKITDNAPQRSLIPKRKPDTLQAPPDEVWVTKQPVVNGGSEWQCLTQALYFEARGETFEGLVAVAEVILNRVDSAKFPDTVCGVVNQGTGKRHRCQFSFTCDGQPEHVGNRRLYNQMGKVAKVMMDGAPRSLTGGATYYHTTAVNPRWAGRFLHTAQIGVHRFYR